MQPDALKDADSDANQPLSAFRQLQQPFLAADSDKKIKGPMGHAFIATNPLLPPEFFATKGVDKLVLEMNKDVPNSLLDNKGQYTVKVATFTGAVLLDQKKIEEVEHGKRMASRLAEAAEKAHKLTTALREKGYDAYEFHDRESSIVTVGSFESVGSQNIDGQFNVHPDRPKNHENIRRRAGATDWRPSQAQVDRGHPPGYPAHAHRSPPPLHRHRLSAQHAHRPLSAGKLQKATN